MTTMRMQLIDALIIFFGGLFLFSIGLASQEIIGFDSRFYLFALEMWRHGASWFPTTYQQPYPDYPVTAILLMVAFSKLMGGMSKFTVVFPSACAAAITLMMTYLIGALHSRRWGISAALFLLFTVTFVMEARSVSLDQFVTATTVISFYLIYSAQLLQKSRRILWIFPILVLSFACRGPIGLVIPAGVVCIFYLLEKDFKKFFRLGFITALLLGVCSAVLLLMAYQAGGAHFLQEVLQKEVLGRMQDIQTPPLDFYFFESFGAYAMAYPFALLVLFGVGAQFNTAPQVKLLQKLTGWALVILLGLSIPADKKVRYILPAAPALALICGYLWMVGREQKYLFLLRRLLHWFCCLFPVICLCGACLIRYRHPELNFSYSAAIGMLSVFQAIVLLVWRQELAVLFIAALSFVLSYILIVEPINLDLNRTRAFVLQTESSRLHEQARLVFYGEGTDGLAIKYLVNMPLEGQPTFIHKPDELEKLSSPVFVVVSVENFQKIFHKKEYKIIFRGKLGREPMVVISKNVFHVRGAF